MGGDREFFEYLTDGDVDRMYYFLQEARRRRRRGCPVDRHDFAEWVDEAAPRLRQKLNPAWTWVSCRLDDDTAITREREMPDPTDPLFGGEHLRGAAANAADDMGDAVDTAGSGLLDDLVEIVHDIWEWLF